MAVIRAARVYHEWTAAGCNVLVLTNIQDPEYAHAELTLHSFTEDGADTSVDFIKTIRRRGQLFFLEHYEDLPKLQVKELVAICRETSTGELVFPDGTLVVARELNFT